MNRQNTFFLSHATDIAERRIRSARRAQAHEVKRRIGLLAAIVLSLWTYLRMEIRRDASNSVSERTDSGASGPRVNS